MTKKTTESPYNLPEALKKILEKNGMSASDLSRQSGVSMATLSRILGGQVSPSLDNVVKIATVLGVSLDSLTGGTTSFAAVAAPVADEKPDSRGRRKEDQGFNPEQDILVSYQYENTTFSQNECGNLLVSAANGDWVESWTGSLVDHETVPQVKLLETKRVDSSTVNVSLIIPQEMVEAGSMVSLISVISAPITSTGARIVDARIPVGLARTFKTPSYGVIGMRDLASKYGRPLLSSTMRPMNGLSPKMYGRAVYETLKGGVDMTADPTMMHSLPDNSWRRRFRFVAEAAFAAQQETGEVKYHAVNISAPTVEDMTARAEYAKELGINMMIVDSSAVGWSALASVVNWCQNNDVIIGAMGGRSLMSATMTEGLIAKLLRFTGCDMVSIGSPLRGDTGNRRHVKGIVDMLVEDAPKTSVETGIMFDQPSVGGATVWPAVGGGHNPWHFPRLMDAMGDDMIIQCGGSVMGHPWGLGSGATACRTAIEAIAQARGEGHNLSVDGRTILQRAARYNSELKAALEYWNEGAFLFGVVKGDAATGAKVEETTTAPKVVTPLKPVTDDTRPGLDD